MPAPANVPNPRARRPAPAATRRRLLAITGDSPLIGVARQVRAWTDSVLWTRGAAADLSMGAAKAILVKPEQRASLRESRRSLAPPARSGRTERQASRRSDRPQGSGAARSGRERESGAAFRDRLAARVGPGTQRSGLVRDALHALVATPKSGVRSRPSAWAPGVARRAGARIVNVYRGSDAARALSDEDFCRRAGVREAGVRDRLSRSGAEICRRGTVRRETG